MSDVETMAPGLRDAEQDTLLRVEALSKDFVVGRRGLFGQPSTLRAVDRVSFDIRRGETFGLVGESGCGKSTVARCVLRLIEPTGGSVAFDGNELVGMSAGQLRRLRRRMQIVFQDPFASLDPRMSIAEIIEEPLRVHGIGTPAERSAEARKAMELVGIPPEHGSRRPHAFSGGQRQRIGIARALVLKPELLVLDEPISALDVSIQAQVLNLLRHLQDELNLSYLFIVHDLSVAEYFCDRLAVLYLGAVAELGSREDLFRRPLHPYTVALLSGIPVPDPERKRRGGRILLQGEVPSLAQKPKGCRFRSRCPVGRDRDVCANDEPLLRQVEPGHWISCHFPGELTPGNTFDQESQERRM